MNNVCLFLNLNLFLKDQCKQSLFMVKKISADLTFFYRNQIFH